MQHTQRIEKSLTPGLDQVLKYPKVLVSNNRAHIKIKNNKYKNIRTVETPEEFNDYNNTTPMLFPSQGENVNRVRDYFTNRGINKKQIFKKIGGDWSTKFTNTERDVTPTPHHEMDGPNMKKYIRKFENS